MAKRKISTIRRFVPGWNYKIGILPQDPEKNDFAGQPKFSEYPVKSVAYDGATLINRFKCKNFQEYLDSNPNEFPTNKRIGCFFKNPDSEMWEFMSEGNPLSPGKSVQLSDGLMSAENSKSTNQNPEFPNSANKIVQQTLQDSITDSRNQLQSANQIIEEWQKRYMDKLEENTKLQAANERLTIQNETLNGIVDGFNKRDEQLSDKPSLMDGIGAALSNPAFATPIAEGLGFIIGLAKQKFGGVQQPDPAEEKFKQFNNGQAQPQSDPMGSL